MKSELNLQVSLVADNVLGSFFSSSALEFPCDAVKADVLNEESIVESISWDRDAPSLDLSNEAILRFNRHTLSGNS